MGRGKWTGSCLQDPGPGGSNWSLARSTVLVTLAPPFRNGPSQEPRSIEVTRSDYEDAALTARRSYYLGGQRSFLACRQRARARLDDILGRRAIPGPAPRPRPVRSLTFHLDADFQLR